ncbi:MAG: DUF2971 domain-containing protein [Promethearchaeota archaeon]|jgi:hypothetical protein
MKEDGEEDNNVAHENVVEPDVLFKYGKFDKYTERIFTHKEIYFSSPDEFNDPFDSKPNIICDGKLKEIKRYLCKLYKKKNPKLSKEKILTHVEKEIITKGQGRIVFEKGIEKFRETTINKLGICCLTEIRDNILMWAHYAKRHTGFCLEFYVNNEFFRLHDRAIKVEYEATMPVINVLKLDNYPKGELGEKLLKKANDWRYEQEWRIVDCKEGPGIQNFPEDALSGVILGCRISEEDKENIFRWCRKREHTPTLYEAIEKQKEFGLDIVKIDY